MSSVVQSARWKLEGTTARLAVNGFSAVIDLLRPSLGLHELHDRHVAGLGATLLGVQLSVADVGELSLPETYVRGDDLVATYLQTAARPFRLQAYWRFIDPATIAGCRESVLVELQVSINTSLLDTRPFVDVATTVVGAIAKQSVDGRLLVRGVGGNWSYFEAAHDSDAATSTSANVPAGVRITHRLFDLPLEKGVILRSRIRGALVPAADDAAVAEAVWRDFTTSQPPLTT